MKTKDEIDKIYIKYTALLSIIEVALGSILHSLKIPLSGHILSLNQGFILTKASLEIPEKSSGAVIGVSGALFKSLSPAGKKLTPMLAISMQGQLFSLGLYIFGNNFVGRLTGMTLLCLWAFIQPITLYFIIFGKGILDIINYFFKKIEDVYPVNIENLYYVLAILIFIKILIACFIVIYAHRMKNEKFEKYKNWASNFEIKDNAKVIPSPFKGALKDILSPIYLVSIALSIIFFFFVESVHTRSIWFILRPITIGYFMFLGIRVFPIERLTSKIKSEKYRRIIEGVLLKIKK